MTFISAGIGIGNGPDGAPRPVMNHWGVFAGGDNGLPTLPGHCDNRWDGLVHELIYGKEGEKTVRQAREALAQASQLLEDVRTKEGVVHNLIYDEDDGEFITNLNAASADVKVAMKDVQLMIADVKAGKGTIGGLLIDPTVYEDLKILLGNVRRNDAVKALVRAAIAGEDKKAKAPVVEQR